MRPFLAQFIKAQIPGNLKDVSRKFGDWPVGLCACVDTQESLLGYIFCLKALAQKRIGKVDERLLILVYNCVKAGSLPLLYLQTERQ